jgi:molybdate transport system substrate-binding protein
VSVRSALVASVALAVLLPLSACSGGSEVEPKTLTVYAASSLTTAFEELGETFEGEHDGVEVELSFAGSSDLVAQIQQGAPADVFASADEANMAKLVAGDLAAGDPVVFATNTLQIAVPPGNPAGVTSLDDLAGDLNLVVCAPEVPCGAAAAQVAEAGAVALRPVSEEQSVTDVLNKVASGEADAGLVYVTDVRGAGDAVEGIAFPEAESVVNRYPIVPVVDAEQPDLAQDFVDLVTSDEGRDVLREAGFGLPESR